MSKKKARKRLRDNDFAMRHGQGFWSEARVIEAINGSGDFFAFQYGISRVAPPSEEELEIYFAEMDAQNLSEIKQPDVLVFRIQDKDAIDSIVAELGGVEKLAATPETDERMQAVFQKAILAIECENSLWIAKQMPGHGGPIAPREHLGGRLGLAKSATAPNIFVKGEDIERLRLWQQTCEVPIHVWQLFFDIAFGIALSDVQKLIDEGLVSLKDQSYQETSRTTVKPVYKVYYNYCYKLGEIKPPPNLLPGYEITKSGHILPSVKFEGGILVLDEEGLGAIRSVAES